MECPGNPKKLFTLTALGPEAPSAARTGSERIGSLYVSSDASCGQPPWVELVIRLLTLFKFAEELFELLADHPKDTRGGGQLDHPMTPVAISDRRRTLRKAASIEQTSSANSRVFQL